MSKEKRGYGTMIVAVVGLFGAVLANIVAKDFGWQNAYRVGGALGLCFWLYVWALLNRVCLKMLKNQMYRAVIS
jgi:uncharacterized membrane protein YeaQ/YmgE (transglycosylase-associated protein family)